MLYVLSKDFNNKQKRRTSLNFKCKLYNIKCYSRNRVSGNMSGAAARTGNLKKIEISKK